MNQKVTKNQLDLETISYLKSVVDSDGKGMPGYFVGSSNYWPIVGFIFGFLILVTTLIVTFPPTEAPAQEAMLQTAGFLLGGWMIVAAFRVWMANASGKTLGHFTFVDSLNLYEVSGREAEITSVVDLQEAKVVQNFNEGKYQNSLITLKFKSGTKSLTLTNEGIGKRVTVFLNSLAYMRAGGEDGTDEEIKALSPVNMAAVAKHISETGNFPRSLSEVSEVDSVDVPEPRISGTPYYGSFFWYLLIVAAAVLLFLGFRSVNQAFREDVIYDRIKELPAKDQPPALRLYLSHPEFNKHRTDAETKLEAAYQAAVTQMIQGRNPEFSEALRMLVLGLAKKPAPVISLVVEEDSSANPEEAKQRIGTTAMELADKWGSTIGDELVIFAQPEDKNIKGMITVRYKFVPRAVEYTVTFRKSPDDEPFKVITGEYPTNAGMQPMIVFGFADFLVGQSCGITRIRPMPLPENDF